MTEENPPNYWRFNLIVILIILLFICFCGFAGYEDYQQDQRKIKQTEKWLDDNSQEVKILCIYPEHSFKGSAAYHYAVIEGMKTKDRKKIPIGDKMPIPNEIWKVTHKKGEIVFVDVEKLQ
jgi:hypothetical protein